MRLVFSKSDPNRIYISDGSDMFRTIDGEIVGLKLTITVYQIKP